LWQRRPLGVPGSLVFLGTVGRNAVEVLLASQKKKSSNEKENLAFILFGFVVRSSLGQRQSRYVLQEFWTTIQIDAAKRCSAAGALQQRQPLIRA
jgi:hypothetical protein